MSGDSEWNEKLFDCCKDCNTCCYGCWCTPCLFGTNAEKIDDTNCCLMCCVYALTANVYLCWIPHFITRKKLREKYNLKEDPSCGDCPTTFFCGPCALCQEAREMKLRENQPSVAYKANAHSGGRGTPTISQPVPDSINVPTISERL